MPAVFGSSRPPARRESRGGGFAGALGMRLPRIIPLLAVTSPLLLVGCETRPANPPLLRFEKSSAHQFEKLELKRGAHEDLVILAFSGGGTRAAAFSYGVLEALRSVEIITKENRKIRMLDEVDVITGISGGSFTALAYGL